MASTRNKNTPENYKLEQLAYIERHMNIMEIQKQTAEYKYLPGNGLLQGHVPSRDLANNYTDIESTLFGIGSTNLVQPLPTVVPEIHRTKLLPIQEGSANTPRSPPSEPINNSNTLPAPQLPTLASPHHAITAPRPPTPLPT
jgi:hypothetical protein